MRDELWIERRKWPDRPHYAHQGWFLGDDEHGLWIELRVGSPVLRGDVVLFHGQHGGLMLLPPWGRSLVWFPEHGEVDLYVDVVTGVERTASSLTMIDLDLDVVRWRDTGVIELVDEDELELHEVTLGYPPGTADQARHDGATILAAALAGEAPYDGVAAAHWAAVAAREG